MNARKPYDIVEFTPDMLAELADLWVAAWAATMPSIDFADRRAWFVAHLSSMSEAGVSIMCACRDGVGIVGFMTLDDRRGHIDQLAVARSEWGSGAGRALLSAAKRRCAGDLYLEVNEENPRAVRFYEREGFQRTTAGVNANSGLKTWRYEWHRAVHSDGDG